MLAESLDSKRTAVTRLTKFDLSDYLPYLLNRVGAAMVVRFSEDALERHDLSISMWRVLAALAHLGAQRQIDVSELTSIDVSTLSRLVSRLVRMGLVTRKRSTRSNREVTLDLTSKAHRLMAELLPIARRLEHTATRAMTAHEVRAVKRLLARMFGNLTQRDATLKKLGAEAILGPRAAKPTTHRQP
jgi:MarR family transcriptional regulator, organic hydroperoxide resistance regulator